MQILLRQGFSNGSVRMLPAITLASPIASGCSPEAARFVYVNGVALNSLRQADEAVRVLAEAWQQFPDNFDIGWAVAIVSRDRGDIDHARAFAGQLAERFPESPQAGQLLSTLSE